MKVWGFLFVISFGPLAWANLYAEAVGFFRDQRASDLMFHHVAFRLENKTWLSASPRSSPSAIAQFSELNQLEEKIQHVLVEIVYLNKSLPIDIAHWQSKFIEFDPLCSWDDQNKTHCSKFVGQVLGVPPSAMSFEGPIWRQIEKFRPLPIGQMGISPNKIYEHLKNTCEMNLRNQ